ncbi:MAG: hypothetical protein MJZ12_04565 [Prevotella sp.]|nr:hypothetical protein [Prevotella sp.]
MLRSTPEPIIDFTILHYPQATTHRYQRERSFIPFLDIFLACILTAAPLSEVTILVSGDARSAVHLSIIFRLSLDSRLPIVKHHGRASFISACSPHVAPFPRLFPILLPHATTVSVNLQCFCPSSHIGFLSCFK